MGYKWKETKKDKIWNLEESDFGLVATIYLEGDNQYHVYGQFDSYGYYDTLGKAKKAVIRKLDLDN
jgi:hypothetical protein